MTVSQITGATIDEVILAYLREAEAEDAAARLAKDSKTATDQTDQNPNQGDR